MKSIIENWPSKATAALCAYCGDYSLCLPLPFKKGKMACRKCYESLTY